MDKYLTTLPDLLEELDEQGVNPDNIVIVRKHVRTLEPIDDDDEDYGCLTWEWCIALHPSQWHLKLTNE
ncbi:hypothetical protein ACFLYB_06400 [Chloroflexota bacterium]